MVISAPNPKLEKREEKSRRLRTRGKSDCGAHKRSIATIAVVQNDAVRVRALEKKAGREVAVPLRCELTMVQVATW
jgi:hypothetical protein